jgi:hypothetical protein
MRVIRRITESVNPAVLVDSGLIVLLFLCAKIQISERNTKSPTIFKLEKAIAKGAEINPDRETNPAQTLSEYYDFVEWAAHVMPWTVINQPEGTDIFTRIDQSLNQVIQPPADG